MENGWRPPLGDAAIAAVFAALGVSLTVSVLDDSEAVAAIVAAAHSLPLAWRRRWPEPVLAVMAATGAVFTAAGWPTVGLGPAIVAGVHGLGVCRPRQQALPLLAAVVVVMAALSTEDGASVGTIVGNGLVLGVGWWIGDRQRATQARAAEAEQRGGELAARAVADERLRIARELHDVVAHALSVIAVQAGTGRVVLDDDPATARAALASIEGQSRAALEEMRRLVTVLRDDSSTIPGPLSPSPGLDDLEALVATTAGSGLPVEVRIEGERVPLPAGAELAAFRIVQEALTNVRRHARATKAAVRVAWQPGAVEVEVVDDGRGAQARPADGSHGLVGIRERVALYGGTVETGNAPGGGFRVAARIPCGGTT